MSDSPLRGYIVGNSTVSLWSLSGTQRLCRSFAKAGIGVVGSLSELQPGEPLLVVRADALIEDRVIRALARAPDTALTMEEAGTEVTLACHVSGDIAEQAVATLQTGANMPAGITVKRVQELVDPYQERLRNVSAPLVAVVNVDNRVSLERRLYRGAYKSVTDLVTKWLWPRPAAWVTGQCARFGVLPNQVTLLGLLLTVLAGVWFWRGQFGIGLLAAWVMTFLDTVDGKLARVTVTASRLGDILDHGIDILHPPFWYLAWGFGVAAGGRVAGMDFATLSWLVLGGYVGGRLAEGAFQLWCAPFSMFSWRPFDSVNRLVTARRNPNLILLTFGWVIGRPDLALLAVVLWTQASTAILIYRLGVATVASRRGALRSWLSGGDVGEVWPIARRWFLNTD